MFVKESTNHDLSEGTICPSCFTWYYLLNSPVTQRWYLPDNNLSAPSAFPEFV